MSGPFIVAARDPAPELRHKPLDPTDVRLVPEGITVEQSWLLDIYTLVHSQSYRAFQVRFRANDGAHAIAHMLVPPGEGPHPAVVAFPILAGSHVVSEALAKALVRRGYVVLRLERHALDLETAEQPDAPAAAFRAAILDARRLLDWLVTQPSVDPGRIAAAGVSLGGMLACVLQGVDERIRAGFFVMAGGSLAEVLYDSGERPVRVFRDRMIERHSLPDRNSFVAWMQQYTDPVDPLRYAAQLDPATVLIGSGRFDRVIPRARTEALWEALSRPAWFRFPSGHYQMFPFFWWAMNRGADHLDRVFSSSASITWRARRAVTAHGEPEPHVIEITE